MDSPSLPEFPLSFAERKRWKWKSGLGMSCRGILCLLGVRKMALELQSEVVELHEDPGKIRARLGDARAGTGARGHPVSDQDGIQHLIVIANYKEVQSLEGKTVPRVAQTLRLCSEA